ncbi:winged helix-turn-helix transcriptional regulator [Catenisphaera adipataccumulans]|jgi:DNA-binding HxlR family transcriptional regulator|uniref:DNA-binding HxlR family transcriptional regulator n=1 Tax=Catenisphaera adipataccumulans TaxID=700500 RepID=A0A7W8FVZ0_9FIRM|nr:helix-turn-helix domain-containing protein [Catenisphaera adipataccumulans]MBB5182140.1 DNA-binding HxlR family transcriptional regulator [Catenisphaera adipataccumulans]
MKQTKFHCPVEATLSLIGGKYKPIILYHLIGQTLRFSELQRIMPQATQKMLTQQLRELEKDGLIHREVYPVVPPKTEYSLTEYGRTLEPVLQIMCDWGNEHLSEYILPADQAINQSGKMD